MVRRLSLLICSIFFLVSSSSPSPAQLLLQPGKWPTLKMSMACSATPPYQGGLAFVNDGVAIIPAGAIWHWTLWFGLSYVGSGDLKIAAPLHPNKRVLLKTPYVTSLISRCEVWRVS
jgi:hypothetical protein